MSYALTLINVAAIAVLVFAVYLPKHKRRDLAFALLGVNLGVHVVSTALMSAEAATSLGFGLGLFGVLSIIRLRSSEISQREVAYYVGTLAIALITGGAAGILTAGVLASVIVVAVGVAEFLPALRRTETIDVTFDRAIADRNELVHEAEFLLGREVDGVHILRVDKVNDLTIAQVTVTDRVRYHTPAQVVSSREVVSTR